MKSVDSHFDLDCIAVVTHIPPGDGNTAAQLINLEDGNTMFIQSPVFYLGEILLLDHNGRNIEGPDGGGKKPSKWSVVYEVFSVDDAEKAVRRAAEVRLNQRS